MRFFYSLETIKILPPPLYNCERWNILNFASALIKILFLIKKYSVFVSKVFLTLAKVVYICNFLRVQPTNVRIIIQSNIQQRWKTTGEGGGRAEEVSFCCVCALFLQIRLCITLITSRGGFTEPPQSGNYKSFLQQNYFSFSSYSLARIRVITFTRTYFQINTSRIKKSYMMK